MRHLILILILSTLWLPRDVSGQLPTASDTALLSFLKHEGFERSHVMHVLSMLTDANGPRLTNSSGYATAARYARQTLTAWGVDSVHFDYWDQPFGRGWELNRFSLSMTSPTYTPLIAWPKAWSPAIKGTLKAEVVYLDIQEEADLEKYKGKLKGKIALFSLPPSVRPSFTPDAWRHADSTLREMSRVKAAGAYQGRRFRPPSEPERLAFLKWQLCHQEGAAAVLEASSRLGDDGTLVVSAATVPYAPEVTYGRRLPAWHEHAPKILPQIVVAAEHYNRLVRQVQLGTSVMLEVTLQCEFANAERGYNVIGEIPGTDLANEVVMIGAHLDSWHSATGATDNAVGCAVMMEAMRILSALHERPRRTIRIALWGGEEQGLLGSRSYVRRVFGERLDRRYPYDSIRLTEAGKKFSVYFNMDYGAGKYRGIYLQGNEAATNVFQKWVAPFAEAGAGTLSLQNATGTDHLSFDAIGLPAFQFIQDPLEYATRTHHANMDLYDKVVEEDLKHNAVMTAFLAWKAAHDPEGVPRDTDR